MSVDFLVSKDSDRGRTWVSSAANGFSVVFSGDAWAKGSPSPDDLKDNFERVTGKEATAWFHKASAAVESNPSLLIAADQASS